MNREALIESMAVLRATIDSFHHPSEHRYLPRQAFGALVSRRRVRYLHRRSLVAGVAADTFLIFDEVFLFRRELVSLGNYRVSVDVDAATAIERAVRRDTGPDEVESRVRYRNEFRYEGA